MTNRVVQACAARSCQANGEEKSAASRGSRPFRRNSVYKGEVLLLLKTGAKKTRRIAMSTSSNTGRKGGFLQGIPQVSTLPVRSLATGGCCGSADQPSNTGCCGEPVTQAPVTANVQAIQSCCGEPAAVSATAAQTTGCCGESVTTPSGTEPATQSGCCN
jgi:hypothetical protein